MASTNFPDFNKNDNYNNSHCDQSRASIYSSIVALNEQKISSSGSSVSALPSPSIQSAADRISRVFPLLPKRSEQKDSPDFTSRSLVNSYPSQSSVQRAQKRALPLVSQDSQFRRSLVPCFSFNHPLEDRSFDSSDEKTNDSGIEPMPHFSLDEQKEKKKIETIGENPYISRHAPTQKDPSSFYVYHPLSALIEKPLFLQNAVRLQQNKQPTFDWNGKSVDVSLMEADMRGEHCIIGRINGDQDPLFSNLRNDQIIFKTFRDHCIMIKAHSTKIGDYAVSYIVTQHQLLEKLFQGTKFAAAKLYNLDSVQDGCGFFLFEYIPLDLPPLWMIGTPLEELNSAQTATLVDLRELFKLTYDSETVPDLSPNNLGYREDGTMAIFDFRENLIDEDERDIHFEEMIRSFNCVKGDKIYQFIREGMAETQRPDSIFS